MKKRILSILAILLVGALALGLRLHAVKTLPIDYDEDDYLGAAQRYAGFLKADDWQAISDYDYNYEHPPLAKMAYAFAILNLPESPLLPELSSSTPPAAFLPKAQFKQARTLAAVFGALEAAALAAINPLAGLLMAAHTWQIKYTSQIMLEPLPSLLSGLAAIGYLQSRRRRKSWLAFSALALGLTAAAKFTYCVVGIAIVIDWLWQERPQISGWSLKTVLRWWGPVLLWGLLAVGCFVAFNPRLWHEPLPRLMQMIRFHGDYSQSAHVKAAGYPIWQPLVWLAQSVPWHRGVFYVMLDLYISLLALVGLRSLWRKNRMMALWLVIGLGFLFIWPTKWPQYVLTITFPLCLAAAQGILVGLWQPLCRLWKYLFRARPAVTPAQQEAKRIARREGRMAIPWLVPGLLVLAVIALFPLIFQFAMALTDFNARSIRDGIQGGVWRAAWQGLSGQVQPISETILGQRSASKEVHYAGFNLLLALLSGAMSETLVFTTLWTVLSVSTQTVLGVGVALMLNRRGLHLARLWQTLFILPWAIPEFVGALVWYFFFTPDFGWLALATTPPADAVRGSSAAFSASLEYTFLSLLVAALWYGFPFIMLAALAAMKMTPPEIYDAAALDGASGLRQLWGITLPLLAPLVLPAIIIRSIFAFNQFYLFTVISSPYPLMTFATVSFYTFSPSGSFGGNFAVSAAINIFTVIALVALILTFNKVSKASEGVTYA